MGLLMEKYGIAGDTVALMPRKGIHPCCINGPVSQFFSNYSNGIKRVGTIKLYVGELNNLRDTEGVESCLYVTSISKAMENP